MRNMSVSNVLWNLRCVLFGPSPRLTLRIHKEAKQMKRRLECNAQTLLQHFLCRHPDRFR